MRRKMIGILALTGILSNTASAGYTCKAAITTSALTCDTNKVTVVKIQPQIKITKIYICGRCHKEFNHSSTTPFCTSCAVPEVEKIIIHPPQQPPPVPRRGSVFMDFEQPQRTWSRESRTETRTRERIWSEN